jgi:hypothetical protein
MRSRYSDCTGWMIEGSEFEPRYRPRIFSPPHRPNRFWGPPSLASKGHRRPFPRGWSGRDVNLTTQLHLWLGQENVDLYNQSPMSNFSIIGGREQLTLHASNYPTNSVAWVRERAIPTELPPLVGEVSANFWGQRATCFQQGRLM